MSLPKINLMQGITPLMSAPRMSEETGLDVYFKRDDMSPIGLGGNKLRNLEYLLADALEKKCKTIVTAASPRSNYLRIFTACCNRLNLKPIVYMRGKPPEGTPHGNYLCTKLLGADIHFIDTEDPFDKKIMDAMYSHGDDAYVIHLALHSGPLASCGYIDAMAEMAKQFEEIGKSPKAIYTAVGSGCTYAGLWAGAKLYSPMNVVGVSVNLGVEDFLRPHITEHIRKASELWGSPVDLSPDELILYDHLKYPSYGEVNSVCFDAIEKIAKWEGFLLDPIYMAKPAAALLEDVPKYNKGDAVVILYSGGSPNLFAHDRQIAEFMH